MTELVNPIDRRQARRREDGFTLVELLIVMALTGILIAVGLPRLTQFTSSRAMTSHVSLLATSMRLARSESIKLGTRVSICPSLDPEAAGGPACNGGAADWASGWVMFSDLGVVGTIDGNDRVIQVQGPLNDSGGIQSVGGATVSFFPNGIAPGAQRTFNFLPTMASTAPGYNEAAQRMCLDNAGSTERRKFTETCP